MGKNQGKGIILKGKYSKILVEILWENTEISHTEYKEVMALD